MGEETALIDMHHPGDRYLSGPPGDAKSTTVREDRMKYRFQQLHQEWDEEKNAPLRFEDMTKGSSRKVWWKCALGHDWKARFSNRVHGNDCPYCAGIDRKSVV